MIGKRQFKSQDERVEYDYIIYLINHEENTAGVIGIEGKHQEIIIPRSINHKSKEYYVTSILENSFNRSELKIVEFSKDSKLQTICKNAFSFSKIKSIRIPSSVISIEEYAFYYCQQLEVIEIPDDSKLQTIDNNAFNHSKIKSIRIPSELIDLKEGWCNYTKNLTKIIVSPENPRFCFFEDKMIIGKSRNEESNYDCLVFCVRDIRQIKIPNFIEHICSCSFDNCEQLETVEFSKDSKLQTIDKNAFFNTQIKSILIPSSVTSIGEYAFYFCKHFEMIEIPDDSKLQTIDKDAFSNSKIKSIRIPSELIDLKEGWCNDTSYLTKISVSPENPRYLCYEDEMIIGKSRIEESNYDCLVFCVRNIREIKIPNFIEHICSCSFDNCRKLEMIEIPDDSKLQTIDKNAFSSSNIKSIRIPSSVTSIGEGAFCYCEQLEIIEMPNDLKLQTIDKNTFSDSMIKKIKVPSSVTSIGEDAFYNCCNLCIIEIPDDSKLQTIGKYAFYESEIKSIQIPSSVTSIGGCAFYKCDNLCIIEIGNSEMISLYQEALLDCQNSLLMVPVHS